MKEGNLVVKTARKPIVCGTCEAMHGICFFQNFKHKNDPYEPDYWCYDEVETKRVAQNLLLEELND